ncbi:YbaB/EbfC DNA-binding family protein [Amycolatopsis marina]|uniref:YbaB/EbfC DNA-binding family protein n=1 Tax=Amycolatopsis marina TaxID=490629 RepID=A0A1I0YU39_9PSEU|nr:YbaB/EbfC family nucleoid-associated protein [Amycolatopsis marina]SFB16356.1 YbaB/EbfC DNA-binding family protein [Amycolatopsis marina]
MVSPNPAEAGEKLEQWAEGLQRKAQRYTQLHERLNATSVTETSKGGEVTITVDANGVPTALSLGERTRGMDPPAVAAQVMATMRRAQAKLREEVSGLVHETVGDDGPGNNIIGQYAERFPDQQEPGADEGPTEMAIGNLEVENRESRRPDQQQPPESPRSEPQRPASRPRSDDDDDWGGQSILRRGEF